MLIALIYNTAPLDTCHSVLLYTVTQVGVSTVTVVCSSGCTVHGEPETINLFSGFLRCFLKWFFYECITSILHS